MGPFASPPVGSYQFNIGTYGLTVLELFRLQMRFRPSDTDTMTNTALLCFVERH